MGTHGPQGHGPGQTMVEWILRYIIRRVQIDQTLLLWIVNHVLEAKLLPRELWWKDQLFVFKKAPIGGGKQCSVEFTALNDRAGDVGI